MGYKYAANKMALTLCTQLQNQFAYLPLMKYICVPYKINLPIAIGIKHNR